VRAPVTPDAQAALKAALQAVLGQQQQQPATAAAAGAAAGDGRGGDGAPAAACAPQASSVRVGEVVCPVHVQAVYRYSVSETLDSLQKVGLLHRTPCYWLALGADRAVNCWAGCSKSPEAFTRCELGCRQDNLATVALASHVCCPPSTHACLLLLSSAPSAAGNIANFSHSGNGCQSTSLLPGYSH
jgi:hypothetical protein